MKIDKPIAKEVILRAYKELRITMGDELLGTMGIPSYIKGNAISQQFAWTKVKKILQLCGDQKNINILDFGCGSGVMLQPFSAHCNILYALDVDLSFAKSTANYSNIRDKIHFIHPDEINSVSDDSIDLIVAANVLEHVPHLEKHLDLFNQKLNQEGCLIVSGPTENALYRLGRKCLQILGHKDFHGEYHVRNIDNIFDVVERQGFKMKRIEQVPFSGYLALYRVGRFIKKLKVRSREDGNEENYGDSARIK